MLSYNNFLKLLVVFGIAAAIVIANSTSIVEVVLAIFCLGIIVEVLCVVRLRALGYSTFEAISRLLWQGEKLSVFFNKTAPKQ